MSSTARTGERRVPLYAGTREPMKVNVYERMQHANTQLVPLFPYYGPGAVVPCGALFRGEPGLDMGHFFHQNTQDEVVCVFGGRGGLLQTGQVLATPKLHGVNSFLRDPEDPDSFLVLVITQRQSAGSEQRERLLFRCRKCHEHLLVHEFGSVPEEGSPDRFPAFPTLTEGVAPAEEFNARRTCPSCGYENPEFPLDRWGWNRWRRQQETVNEARRALLEKAAEDLS